MFGFALATVGLASIGFLLMVLLSGAFYGSILVNGLQENSNDRINLAALVGTPLFAIALLLFVVAQRTKDVLWQGMFLNLSATAIGVMLTVFFLELILEWHERERWSNLDAQVIQEIVTQASGVLAIIEGLHVGPSPNRSLAYLDEETGDLLLDEQHLHFLRGDLILNIRNSIGAHLVANTLPNQMRKFEEIKRNMEHLVELHKDRISPELRTSIHRIVSNIDGAQSFLTLSGITPITRIDAIALNFQFLVRDSLSLVEDYWSEW